MSQFLESICCLDGKPLLLEWHQQRVNDTFEKYFKGVKPFDLKGVPMNVPLVGKFKCRLVYDPGNVEYSFIAYSNPNIHSFKLVVDDGITYEYKSTDRTLLDVLFSERGAADDILIVKNGFITDAYFTNLAFYDGNQWFTPSQPLLKGVKRAHLIAQNILVEKEIKPTDLACFEKISFINAMLDLGEVTVEL